MDSIIKLIHRVTGRDISAYADSFVEKTINQRISETSSATKKNYLTLLEVNPEEVETLLNSLNISYSLFFRNPLDFYIIERFILPSLFHRKSAIQSSRLRFWSAGCADGPEPYSLAMIANELSGHQSFRKPPLIIATDLSERALGKAEVGSYYSASVQNVTIRMLEAYFTNSNQVYQVSDQLKNFIEFSRYDLLDTKTSSPPFGIFGGFDMVICCNLMVYYKPEYQALILEKLFHSLDNKGFLMVDSSEKAIVKSFGGFRLYSALSNVFVKI